MSTNGNGKRRMGICADCKEWKPVHRDSLSGGHRPPFEDRCGTCHDLRHMRDGFVLKPQSIPLLDWAQDQEDWEEAAHYVLSSDNLATDYLFELAKREKQLHKIPEILQAFMKHEYEYRKIARQYNTK